MEAAVVVVAAVVGGYDHSHSPPPTATTTAATTTSALILLLLVVEDDADVVTILLLLYVTERSEVSNASPKDELCLYCTALQSTFHVLRYISVVAFSGSYTVTIVIKITLHSTSLYFASDRRERRCDYIVDNDDGTNRFVSSRAF